MIELPKMVLQKGQCYSMALIVSAHDAESPFSLMILTHFFLTPSSFLIKAFRAKKSIACNWIIIIIIITAIYLLISMLVDGLYNMCHFHHLKILLLTCSGD